MEFNQTISKVWLTKNLVYLGLQKAVVSSFFLHRKCKSTDNFSEPQTNISELSSASQPICFAGIGNIEYKPDAGPGETLVFKHYNAKEVVMGKSMEDWLRFSVCYWHTFRGSGTPRRSFAEKSHWSLD